MRTNPAPLIPAEYDGQVAFSCADLERMKLGKISFFYEEIARGNLKATKRGRYTVFLRPHLESWLAAMPALKLHRASARKPPPKPARRRRAPRVASAEASA